MTAASEALAGGTVDLSSLSQESAPSQIEFEPGSFPDERYQAISSLGSGASGEVFLCRDRLLSKNVAIKRLHRLTADELLSFQNEARATSSLRDPAIMTALDFGASESGIPFMVMEYFPGRPIDHLVAEHGPLGWKAAVELGLKLAQALSHAHSKGIYHRDLKPANVLLLAGNNDQCEVKLIDFGIARFVKPKQTDQNNTLAGTPAYMSPDVVNGLSYDARSEIYSLGCVLYFVLTGRPPFLGESALETFSMHTRQEVEPVSRYAEVPEELNAIIGKCLEKDPADRFQSMNELTEALKKDWMALPVVTEAPARNDRRAVPELRIVAAIATLIVAGICGLQFLPISQHNKNALDYRLEAAAAASKGDVGKASGLYLKSIDEAQGSDSIAERLEGLNDLAKLKLQNGLEQEAERYLHQALRVCDTARNESRDSTDIISLEQRKLIDTLAELAGRLKAKKQFKQAEVLYTEALNRNRRSMYDDHSQHSRLLSQYANLLTHQGRVEEADRLLSENDVLSFTSRDSASTGTVQSKLRRAEQAVAENRRDDAEKLIAQSLTPRAGTDPQAGLNIQMSIVSLQIQSGNYKEAEKLLRELRRQSAGKRVDVLDLLGKVLLHNGKIKEAQTILESALADKDHLIFNGVDFKYVVSASLFLCYWTDKKFRKAEPLLNAILRSGGTPSIANAVALHQVGDAVRRSDTGKALAIYRKALEICEHCKNDKDMGELHLINFQLATLSFERGDRKSAADYMNASFQVLEESPLQFKDLSGKYKLMAEIYSQHDMPDKATLAYRRVLDCLRNVPGKEIEKGKIFEDLARNYRSLRQTDNQIG
ncbi:MAG: protein kinase, partial [Cyanobacteria bacterium]|nr:protein kinase [Cyanobacteriota bacterium]